MELDIFNYNDMQVRTVVEDGEPWFVAADVAKVLGYSSSRAMVRTLDDDERGVQILHSPSGDQEYSTINESGLYSVILRSRVEGARRFKKWVTAEVLPSIRKTGAYSTVPALSGPELVAAALVEANSMLESAKAELEVARPKVEGYDELIATDGLLTMQEAAKALGIGPNTMFRKLRQAGVLIAKAPNRNLPYQRYMHHFDVKVSRFTDREGDTHVSQTTMVRPSGLDFLRRKLNADVIQFPLYA